MRDARVFMTEISRSRPETLSLIVMFGITFYLYQSDKKVLYMSTRVEGTAYFIRIRCAEHSQWVLWR